jgi:hypothetical protein
VLSTVSRSNRALRQDETGRSLSKSNMDTLGMDTEPMPSFHVFRKPGDPHVVAAHRVDRIGVTTQSGCVGALFGASETLLEYFVVAFRRPNK